MFLQFSMTWVRMSNDAARSSVRMWRCRESDSGTVIASISSMVLASRYLRQQQRDSIEREVIADEVRRVLRQHNALPSRWSATA